MAVSLPVPRLLVPANAPKLEGDAWIQAVQASNRKLGLPASGPKPTFYLVESDTGEIDRYFGRDVSVVDLAWFTDLAHAEAWSSLDDRPSRIVRFEASEAWGLWLPDSDQRKILGGPAMTTVTAHF